MSVPLFIDSDYLDENNNQVRLIYWKLNIKEIDFDDICSCHNNPNNPNNFNEIKLHFFLNHLVIKGMKGYYDHYGFYDKNDFKKLFDIAYKYKPEYNYITIDQSYVMVSKEGIPEVTNSSGWYERGSILRIEESEFSQLMYNMENMAFNYTPTSLVFSETETKIYFEFLDEF